MAWAQPVGMKRAWPDRSTQSFGVARAPAATSTALAFAGGRSGKSRATASGRAAARCSSAEPRPSLRNDPVSGGSSAKSLAPKKSAL